MTDHSSAQRASITVIGLGLMGTALSKRLLEHGWQVHVWNRTRSKADSLLKAGATWTDRPLSQTPLVLISLFSSDVVTEVLTAWLDDIRDTTVLIDTTTGSPESSEHWAEQARIRGGSYLDAPISGSSDQTLRGEATVMVAGCESAFKRCVPLWAVLGRRCFYVGRSGNAARTKLVSNLVLGLNRAAAAEGLRLAEALGLNLPSTLAVLCESPARSQQLETKGPKMISGDFSPQARLAQHLKDVRLMLAAAREQGIHLPLTETHRLLLEQAEALGYGNDDNSAIIQALREAQT